MPIVAADVGHSSPAADIAALAEEWFPKLVHSAMQGKPRPFANFCGEMKKKVAPRPGMSFKKQVRAVQDYILAMERDGTKMVLDKDSNCFVVSDVGVHHQHQHQHPSAPPAPPSSEPGALWESTWSAGPGRAAEIVHLPQHGGRAPSASHAPVFAGKFRSGRASAGGRSAGQQAKQPSGPSAAMSRAALELFPLSAPCMTYAELEDEEENGARRRVKEESTSGGGDIEGRRRPNDDKAEEGDDKNDDVSDEEEEEDGEEEWKQEEGDGFWRERESGSDNTFDAKAFLCASSASGAQSREMGVVLCGSDHRESFEESALLGIATAADGSTQEVYLNTHEPFCAVAVGVQGSGKSHSLACILESCLVPVPRQRIVEMHQPMCALVLHYDSNVASVCEVTGIIAVSKEMAAAVGGGTGVGCCLARDSLLVLVSPSFYLQRKQFYGSYCNVAPLLFSWSSLTAEHIRLLMRLSSDDQQLYVSSLLELLRKYQRCNRVPPFAAFLDEVRELCSLEGQKGALRQRLQLLEAFILESDVNKEIRADGRDLAAMTRGMAVVVDLTDPLLSRDEICGVFQVLTEQFRAIPSRKLGGKVLALDEAHKFLEGKSSSGLSAAIVNCARLMRNDGLRIIVSTQSPLSLPPELLELSSLTMLHRFYSHDWFEHLARKMPLPPAMRGQVTQLGAGHALVFASRHRLAASFCSPAGDAAPAGEDGGVAEAEVSRAHNVSNSSVIRLAVRRRLTSDRGATKTNRK